MSGAASRRDHQRFCVTEGWDVVRNARGQHVGHHLTYELTLLDGQLLRTRISRPANQDTYGPSLWAAILRDQLVVTEQSFWSCVRDRVQPPRPGIADTPVAATLPAGLVHQLKTALGLRDAEVAAMSTDEAVALMAAYWSKPPS